MYYVPDNTEKCGYYECKECGMKFLSLDMEPETECPYCEKEFDLEIGPDEVMPETGKDAKLIKIAEGEEVEKLDQLLSLALTGGNFDWL